MPAMTLSGLDLLAREVDEGFDGALWLPPTASRPWRCGIHPDIGALCFEPATSVEEVPTAADRLATAVEDLRLTLDQIGIAMPIIAKVFVPAETAAEIEGRARRSVVSSDSVSAVERSWSVHPDDFATLRAALWPEADFGTVRQRPSDEKRTERDADRVILDEQQLAVASWFGSETVEVRGPAGSGKTLILLARARLLLSAHPDWKVQFLCFNRALVTYVRSLVADLEGLEVDTVSEFAKRYSLGFDVVDDQQAGRARSAERRGVGSDTIDALLIDEAQDINGAWQSWAASCVRDGRGGVLVVGDDRQSIYLDRPSHGLEVDRIVDLERAYRSTRQIMAVAQTMATSAVHRLVTAPPEGPPVQLVYGGRWDDQADSVANEIQSLVESGEYDYGDIAVLYTRRASQANRLVRTLEEYGVPFHWVNRDPTARRTLVPEMVSLSTVHAAKGREFPVVFVFGVEALKAAEAKQRNIGYVAATRAMDRLFLTFTRPNDMIRAISEHDDVESWTWPDDWES